MKSSNAIRNFKSRIQKIDYKNPYRIKSEIEKIRTEINMTQTEEQKNILIQEMRLMGKLLIKQPIRSQAVILRDDAFLVIKCLGRSRQDIFYTLPGGGLHQKESPEDALHREVFEELGVQVKIQKKLPDFINPEGNDFYIKYHTYVCHLIGEIPKGFCGLETHTDILEPFWMPLESFQTLAHNPTIKLQIWPNIESIVVELNNHKKSESH